MIEVEKVELDLDLSIWGAFKKSKPELGPDKLKNLGLNQSQGGL